MRQPLRSPIALEMDVAWQTGSTNLHAIFGIQSCAETAKACLEALKGGPTLPCFSQKIEIDIP